MLGASLLSLSLVCSASGDFNQSSPNRLWNSITRSNPNEVKIPVLPGQYVAFQDGNNLWKVIPNSPDSPFQRVPVNDPAGRYSVYYGPDPASTLAPFSSLFHGTLSELKADNENQEMGKIDGTISGAPKAIDTLIRLCTHRNLAIADPSGMFSLPVPVGKSVDVGAAFYQGKFDDASLTAKSAIVERGVTPNSTLNLDWGKAIDLVPKAFAVTDIPIGLDLFTTRVEFRSAAGARYLAYKGLPEGSTTFEFPALPEKFTLPTDSYKIYAAASNDDHEVEVLHKISVGPYTVSLPQPIDPPAPLVVSTSPVRLSFEGVQGSVFETTITTEKEGGPTLAIVASKAWLGTQTTYVMPELQYLPGWHTSFNLPKETLNVSHCALQGDPAVEFISATKFFIVKP